MDELLAAMRTVRRLALVAAIHCAVSSAFADDSAPRTAKPSATGLRGFLNNGWVSGDGRQSQRATADKPNAGSPKSSPVSGQRNSEKHVRSEDRTRATPPRPHRAAPTKADAESKPTPLAKAGKLGRPDGEPTFKQLLRDTTPPPKAKSAASTGKRMPAGLPSATLVRPRPSALIVPPLSAIAPPSAAIAVAPTSPSKHGHREHSKLPPQPSDRSFAQLVEENAAKSARVTIAAKSPASRTPAAAAPTPEVSRLNLPDARPQPSELGGVDSPKLAESTRIEIAQSLSPKVAEQSHKPRTSTRSEPTRDRAAATAELSVAEPTTNTAVPRLPEPVRENHAIEQDVVQHAETRPRPTPVDSVAQLPSLDSTATVHARRLREMARGALQQAEQRHARGASHSARKYATDALRHVVDMNDVVAGGTHHAKSLKSALDAIRESADFAGRFGVVDEQALQRMVVAHKTDVLKQRDLGKVSPLLAMETYLAKAKLDLVAALGESREGSDAVLALARAEMQIGNVSGAHTSAVALTYQRAAVEVAPHSAIAHSELGGMLLKQGLVQQAALALQRSVQIEPSRAGYRKLLAAAQQLGDAQLARFCVTALEKQPAEVPVRVKQLEPHQFAATYRPTRVPAAQSVQTPAAPPVQTASTRVAQLNPKPTSQQRAETPKKTGGVLKKARGWFSFGNRTH